MINIKNFSFSKIKPFEPFFWVYFVWYYLPISRAAFRSATYNKLFFALFAIGCGLCILDYVITHQTIRFQYNPLFPVLAYLLVFSILVLMDIGTAGKHIRVSFTFWGSLIAYYLTSVYPNAQKRLVRLGMCLLLITSVTSLVGVIVNPRAARILTYSANDISEDLAISLLNIGGIAFFQGLVICVPILLSCFFQKRIRIIAISALALIFISLLSASFTISLIIFFVALALGYFANNSMHSRVILVILCCLIIILIPWSDLLMYISENINNSTISDRLRSLASSLSSGSLTGGFSSRFKLYYSSLNTFLEHPLGVGPEYTYVNYQNGIGYHSQLLDDLARYGIFALAFYVAFFFGYYKLLKRQWSKINMKQIAFPVVAVYLLFLIFNPGFTSPHEGVLMLLLIPALPDIFYKNEIGTQSINNET